MAVTLLAELRAAGAYVHLVRGRPCAHRHPDRPMAHLRGRWQAARAALTQMLLDEDHAWPVLTCGTCAECGAADTTVAGPRPLCRLCWTMAHGEHVPDIPTRCCSDAEISEANHAAV